MACPNNFYCKITRKAEYILDFARKVKSGEFDLDAVWKKSDDEVIAELSARNEGGLLSPEN